MKRLLCAALLLGLTTIPAWAGPLKPKWIGSDAQWVAHVDVDAARDSTIGQFIIEHRDELDLDFGELEEMGINPLEDFYSITLYGAGDPEEDGVIIVQMNDKIDGLIDMAKEQADGFEEIEVLGRTAYSIDNGEKVAYVHKSSSGRRTVLIATSDEALADAIGVIEGDRDNITDGDDGVGGSPRKGAIFSAFMTDASWMDMDNNPASKIINMSDSVSAQVGEYQNEAYAEVSFDAGNEDDARNINDIINGVLAMGRMITAQGDSEMAHLSEFIKGIEVMKAWVVRPARARSSPPS